MLRPTDVAGLALHLAGCAPCRAYLRTCRLTHRLLRDSAGDVRMPEEMKRRLCADLLGRLSRGSRR